MTVRDATYLKARFETGDIPSQTDFGDLIDTVVPNALVRTAEYFGAVATAFDTSGDEDDAATAVDNLTALQAAIDWSAGTGGTVLMGGGVYGFDGTLVLKSNTSLIGRGRNNTKLLQLDTAWPTCMAPASTGNPASDGAAFITLKGFELNGGWNFQRDISTSGNWRHFGVADMTQIGLHLFTPSGGANDLSDIHRIGTVDPFNVIEDLTIRNIAGTGYVYDGRGESFHRLLRIASCATDGWSGSGVDNWSTAVTIHNCGNRGYAFNGGNNRLSDFKAWYIGMMVDEEPAGCGIEFESSSMSTVVTSNVTTQDTYGPGVRFRGKNMHVKLGIDEAGGGRLDQFAQGWQGTRTRSNSWLEMVQAECCNIELAVSGSITQGSPYLVDFNGSSIFDNVITLVHNRRQASPSWNTSTPIRTSAGYTNNKCWNLVKTHDGIILHGAVTQSRLTDAADQVNTYKGFGFRVPVTDGANGRWATKLANGTWEMGDETILTPV
jgi:hypothetical protein